MKGIREFLLQFFFYKSHMVPKQKVKNSLSGVVLDLHSII